MGYYTHYELSVSGPKEFMDEIEADADGENPAWSVYDDTISDWVYGLNSDSRKWYYWEEDVTAVSEKYPHLLFEVTGEGEDAGDIWHAWARNGKVHVEKAKISWDTPNLEEILPRPNENSF